MAEPTLRNIIGCISAAREHLPNQVIAAATRARAIATEPIPKVAGTTITSAKQNPVAAAGVVLAATGLTIAAAPVVVAAPALLVSGFGGGGVGAGTIAAGVQGGIGNVVAGSVFATLQSAGAGGAGLAVVNGVVQISGGVMAVAGSGITFFKSRL